MKTHKSFIGNSVRVVLVTLLAISLWRCADQQPENSVARSVQFAVHTVASSKSENGRTMGAYLPAGTELLLSVQKSNGESELDHERVELLKLGDGYVSGPIALTPGTYSVTDFMLVLGDSVLYLTPQAGSPRAGEVASPLPYSFTVSADALLTLDAEVVRVAGASPADFGYVAFNVNDKSAGPSILLAAFAADDDGLRLTDADAFILDGLDTLDHIALEPQTNTWSFTLDTAATYTLVVARHGSMRYARPFIYTDLKEELDGKPLRITLTPAVTVVATYRGSDRTFWGNAFTGPDEELFGRMYIDFGDHTGLHNWLIGGKFYPGTFNHAYAQAGTYFTSINGDLDMFLNFNVISELTEIDVTALRYTKGVGFNSTYASSVRYLKVSRIAPYTYIDLANTSLTSASVSEVIDDVYAGVIHNNTHNGMFDYTNVATPSSEALTKLEELESQYGWTIRN
jgi:hypothetical protein